MTPMGSRHRKNSKARRFRRAKLFAAQSGRCYWCGGPMSVEKPTNNAPPSRDYATFDELLPQSKGGTQGYANCVLAHSRCNKARRDGVASTDVRARRVEEARALGALI